MTLILAAIGLQGCAALPVEIVAPVPQRIESYSPPGEQIEQTAPLKCFEKARHFVGVVEVPCAVANEAHG